MVSEANQDYVHGEETADGQPTIRALEDNLFDDLKALAEGGPDPLAPIGLRIAYTLAWGRARAEAERIASLHERQAKKRGSS